MKDTYWRDKAAEYHRLAADSEILPATAMTKLANACSEAAAEMDAPEAKALPKHRRVSVTKAARPTAKQRAAVRRRLTKCQGLLPSARHNRAKKSLEKLITDLQQQLGEAAE